MKIKIQKVEEQSLNSFKNKALNELKDVFNKNGDKWL